MQSIANIQAAILVHSKYVITYISLNINRALKFVQLLLHQLYDYP